MSDSALRTEIKTIMNTVTGIGQVHDYERWTTTWGTFLNLFKDTASGVIHGWEITRSGIKLEKITQKYKATYTYVIKGYYAIKDDAASEKIFNAVIDLIVQKFIDTKITGSQGHSLPQATPIQPRTFGSVLCHYAEIRMNVAEILEETQEATVDLLKAALDYYLKPGDDTADASDEVALNV